MSIKNEKVLFLFLGSLFFLACSHSGVSIDGVDVIEKHSGKTQCFPGELTDDKGRPLTCEASAAVYSAPYLYIASDKPVERPRSSLFRIPNEIPDEKISQYVSSPVFDGIRKIEDMAVDHQTGMVFAVTAFDRVDKESPRWDSYNTLVAFHPNNESHALVANEIEKDGYVSSLSLRDLLGLPLDHPYYKIEGLAVLPGNRLAFGIREIGKSYKDFSYVVKILVAKYQLTEQDFLITEAPRSLVDISSDKLVPGRNLGISSLAYNATDHSLFVLTSFEKGLEQDAQPLSQKEGEVNPEADLEQGKSLGAYLWRLSLDQVEQSKLSAGRAPSLEPVYDASGTPISFAHKAEAVSILPNNRLLIVHDDDKVLTSNGGVKRKPSEFWYHVLQF